MQKAHYGIDVRAQQDDGRDRSGARVGRRSEIRIAQKLRAKVGRRVEKNPRTGRRRDGDLRLRTRAKARKSSASPVAIGTSAIPLRKPAARGRAEDFDSHSESELEFGVRVRADFAVQIDNFVLRCGPFHGCCSS